MSVEKTGAVAALICGATYIFGFVLLVGPLAGSGLDESMGDGAAAVAFMAEHTTLARLWFLVIYVLNGAALAILAVALSVRIGASCAGHGKAIFAFGVVWTTLVLAAGMAANTGITATLAALETDPERAAQIWQMTQLLENGIGGGNEVAGGLWALAIGLGGLRSTLLARPLSWCALIVGAAGLATLIPPLAPVAGAVFGLGFILWFLWAGIALLRAVPVR